MLRILASSLRRHPAVPALIVLQIAVACAILCNVLFLAWQRIEPMLAASGMDTAQLALIDQLSPANGPFTRAQTQAGLAAIGSVPGVQSVTSAFALPMVTDGLVDAALQGPTGARVGVNGYAGEGLLHTLGLELVAGRDFLPDEYRDWGVGYPGSDTGNKAPLPIIITASLSRQLFGARSPLEKVLVDPGVKDGSVRYRVVGVVRHLLRNQFGLATDGRADNTILEAQRVAGGVVLAYAVRIAPGQMDDVLPRIRQAVDRVFRPMMAPDASPPRVMSYRQRRERAFAGTWPVLWLFAGLVCAVVLVVGLGIFGLSGFWVQQRTRQIGIQRALGARRHHVIAQFLAENGLLVVAGLLIGMALAFFANVLLMRYYELARLPWSFLPVGALVVLLLGQFAALGPALRAAAVPPVVATRSV